MQEFFECNLIDMQVELTKDCLGSFVERYLPLFIEEINFFMLTYSEELR
jgi:hypothetical protein